MSETFFFLLISLYSLRAKVTVYLMRRVFLSDFSVACGFPSPRLSIATAAGGVSVLTVHLGPSSFKDPIAGVSDDKRSEVLLFVRCR